MGSSPPQPQDCDYSRYTGEAGQQVAQTSYGMREGSGGSDIFIPDMIGDFPKFEVKSVGTLVFDIIMGPAGDKHPMVVSGRIKPDTMVHICWAYIHKALSGNQWRICPARTYGKRCPACEERSRIMAMSSLTDEQVKKAIEPFASGKHPLGLYNVISHTTLQPQFVPTWREPVMYWPITNAYMEAILQGKAKSDALMEGTGYINYFWPTAGPQGGRHIKVDVVQDGKYFKFQGHMFYQRQAPVPHHVLAQARTLSDFLYIGDDWDSYYDELKEIVDVIVEAKASAPDLAAGLNQPTGMGYAPPYAPAAPAPGLFNAPPPQRGRFQECEPFGSKYDSFDECQDCSVRVECHAHWGSIMQKPALGDAPAAVPVPGAAMPRQPATPQPPPPPPPPQAPVPRRRV